MVNNNHTKNPVAYQNMTTFRQAERRIRKMDATALKSDLIDFLNFKSKSYSKKIILASSSPCIRRDDFDQDLKWLQHGKQLNSFHLAGHDGFLFIPNPFSREFHQRFIHLSLSHYAKYPNNTNLDLHWTIPPDGIYSMWTKEREFMAQNPLNESIPSDLMVHQKNLENDSKTTPLSSSFPKSMRPSELILHLRWATLGFQYDWASRTYPEENGRESFPSELENLSSYLLSRILPRHPALAAGNYCPQAGIVNFYQSNDALTGHVDRSELNMEVPLISLSFGLPCVFLLGGETVEEDADAILLRSGDVIVLDGNARRAYHGVPRVLEAEEDICVSCPDTLSSNEYVKRARININVRQVS